MSHNIGQVQTLLPGMPKDFEASRDFEATLIVPCLWLIQKLIFIVLGDYTKLQDLVDTNVFVMAHALSHTHTNLVCKLKCKHRLCVCRLTHNMVELCRNVTCYNRLLMRDPKKLFFANVKVT